MTMIAAVLVRGERVITGVLKGAKMHVTTIPAMILP